MHSGSHPRTLIRITTNTILIIIIIIQISIITMVMMTTPIKGNHDDHCGAEVLRRHPRSLILNIMNRILVIMVNVMILALIIMRVIVIPVIRIKRRIIIVGISKCLWGSPRETGYYNHDHEQEEEQK